MSSLPRTIRFQEGTEHNNKRSPPPRSPSPYPAPRVVYLNFEDRCNISVHSSDSESSRSFSSDDVSEDGHSQTLIQQEIEDGNPFSPPNMVVGVCRILWNALRRSRRMNCLGRGRKAKRYLGKMNRDERDIARR